jgi:predicted GIY-YIG superfamily endonuclease
MRYVYILRCRDESLYIGETDDVMLRLHWHNEGRACVYTACRLPVSLVYAEQFATRIEAVKRERQLKRWTREKNEALIAGDLRALKMLSRSRQSR